MLKYCKNGEFEKKLLYDRPWPDPNPGPQGYLS